VTLGHDVTLLAPGDSRTAARLVPTVPESLRAHAGSQFDVLRDRYKWIVTGKAVELLEDGDFDIIHNHLGWRLLPFARRFKHKLVTTLHSPLEPPEQQVVLEPYAGYAYVSISLNQRKGMPGLHFAGNAYNGIDVERFTVGDGSGGYLAFLGRMSPEKGPVDAIKAAKASGQRLRMAAKVDVVDKEYFESEVLPLVDGKQIEFIGEVGHDQKVEFLGKARALLMPIHWEEPFGLVNIEAMACGTPVIGYTRGALPEIIEDGISGFLCDDVDAMAKRVGDLEKISRQACRARTEALFSKRHMAQAYLEIYQAVLDSQQGPVRA
jgi:glycosyltransferase involved in cell wall biosynthesis